MNEDVKTYAHTLVDQLINIKDFHRGELLGSEVEAINDVCNLIIDNMDNLEVK